MVLPSVVPRGILTRRGATHRVLRQPRGLREVTHQPPWVARGTLGPTRQTPDRTHSHHEPSGNRPAARHRLPQLPDRRRAHHPNDADPDHQDPGNGRRTDLRPATTHQFAPLTEREPAFCGTSTGSVAPLFTSVSSARIELGGCPARDGSVGPPGRTSVRCTGSRAWNESQRRSARAQRRRRLEARAGEGGCRPRRAGAAVRPSRPSPHHVTARRHVRARARCRRELVVGGSGGGGSFVVEVYDTEHGGGRGRGGGGWLAR